MKKFIVAVGLILMICIIACQKDYTGTSEVNRANDPWVFRSVLDLKPRMLTIALDKDIWLAYNTVNGSLYKVWKGIVNFEGAVYDGAHGPQPTSVGDMYLLNEEDSAWSLSKNGTVLDAKFQYKGHRFVNDNVELMYAFSDGNNTIHVQEEIRLEESEKGKELIRIFKTEGLSDGYTVKLNTKASSIVDNAQFYASEGLKVIKSDAVEYDGRNFLSVQAELSLSSNPVSLHMKILEPTIDDPNIEDGFDVDDSSLPEGAQLIAKNDCKTCHNKNKKTVGPAYVSIAKKYEHNDANTLLLSNKIKLGGTGIWGQQEMTPHPEIPDADIKEMVNYIFSTAEFEGVSSESADDKAVEKMPANKTIRENDLIPGAATRIYTISKTQSVIPKNMENGKAIMGGILPNFDNLNGGDFKELDEHFALLSQGYFEAAEDGIYAMRLWSDDGSRIYINDKEIISNDGYHGTEMREGKVGLKKGYHKFRLEFFQGGGGKYLSWNYKPENAKAWEVVPARYIQHHKDQQEDLVGLSLPMSIMGFTPGDQSPVAGVHPSFSLSQARPDGFQPKVGGLDFLSDGRAVVSTWDSKGAVYLVDNVSSGDTSAMSVKCIAFGLAEPLGIQVINDDIYVMQKQEMTKLVDTNGDDIIDEYLTLNNDWGVSANFHEFGFGLEEKDGYLYANLATGIMPGGAGMVGQHPDRGSAIRVNINSGEMEKVATGLRTPNGIGLGYNGELFIADNQGDWLPSSKILHVKQGSWYGSRAVDFEGTANLVEEKPVVWLPQDEIGNSPSTPSYLNVGPYKNQMIHGEVTHGGIKRVFVEEVNGKLQGCLFRFMQGLEAGVNRIAWGPDGALYAGGIGNPGNWQHNGTSWFGLQRLEYNGESAFEMLAVRAKSNGIEIEFTEALQELDGWKPSDYEIRQWKYVPTAAYGGPKVDEKRLNILSVNISEDRKKVFLELDGMQEDHVIYVRLHEKFVSEKEHSLWSSEAWYTMNSIPVDQPGFVSTNRPDIKLSNTLTASEITAGWKLLFDGNNLDSWRAFKNESPSSKWTISGDALHFNPKATGDGGDIMTKETYENFDLSLEWKIQNCGNSGIFYNVVMDEKYDNVWETGPEMQVLDNVCHPDTKFVTHRAGDLYDLIQCSTSTVKPAGEWNKIRIKSNKGDVEFWMNGYKVVEFKMHDDNWKDMIANSKFKDMPGFGTAKSGHIALQDHGDKVWFRNIKIKEL